MSDNFLKFPGALSGKFSTFSSLIYSLILLLGFYCFYIDLCHEDCNVFSDYSYPCILSGQSYSYEVQYKKCKYKKISVQGYLMESADSKNNKHSNPIQVYVLNNLDFNES